MIRRRRPSAHEPGGPAGRRAQWLPVAIGVLVLANVIVGVSFLLSGHAPPPAPRASGAAATLVPIVASPPALPLVQPTAVPTIPPSPPQRVVIPKIGVSSTLLRLGLTSDGSLEVPADFSKAGWWEGGTQPGQPGPAVIVGHVDSTSGPAVFFHLRDLNKGDAVWVWRGDGSKLRFVVQRKMEVPKTSFPSQQVYGPTATPTLRLVTCGGAFNHSTGHYLDNIIVFANLASAVTKS